MGLFFLQAPKIGMDLGTSQMVVYVEGKGILLTEPSIVARELSTGKLVAVGSEAVKLTEQAPGKYVISLPFKNGTISDYETTVEILKYLIKKVVRFTIQKPYLLLGATDGLTKVEKQALIDAAHQAGVQQTFFQDVATATAIGADMPMDVPAGTLIVDIGGGTTTASIFSYGRVVNSRSIKVGGHQMDEAIVHYMRREHSLVIHTRQAEQIKWQIGTAHPTPDSTSKRIEVTGKEVRTGSVKKVAIQGEEVAFVLQKALTEMIQVIKETLAAAPPEVAADLIGQGVVLTGGGALLQGMTVFLSDSLQVPVQLAKKPEFCVAHGLGASLKNIKQWKKEHDQQVRRS